MIEQPSFAFTEKRYLALVKLLDRLIEVLADGRWYQARELKTLLHTSDRKVRQLAEFSDGRVISGQRGYRLLACATNDEVDHAERWLLSQARRMTERAVEIRRCRNRGGRAA